MPYDNLTQLPKAIKGNLPKHAQEIYQSAFNSAWDTYSEGGDRQDDSSQEETAHRVAWAAVKTKYRKNNGKWIKKEGD